MGLFHIRYDLYRKARVHRSYGEGTEELSEILGSKVVAYNRRQIYSFHARTKSGSITQIRKKRVVTQRELVYI